MWYFFTLSKIRAQAIRDPPPHPGQLSVWICYRAVDQEKLTISLYVSCWVHGKVERGEIWHRCQIYEGRIGKMLRMWQLGIAVVRALP